MQVYSQECYIGVYVFLILHINDIFKCSECMLNPRQKTERGKFDENSFLSAYFLLPLHLTSGRPGGADEPLCVQRLRARVVQGLQGRLALRQVLRRRAQGASELTIKRKPAIQYSITLQSTPTCGVMRKAQPQHDILI